MIKLLEIPKPYYCILPYCDSACYADQRMPMGLGTCSTIWQS